MALTPAGAPTTSTSPLSSGRTSPLPRRYTEEDPTKKDPKYKRFTASIDRALSLFESNNLQEWADYISFLSRLLKALQSHPSLPHIPRKREVAMRLSQCLHPSRPSGVHQKTLEVYSYIFSLIGRDGLARDLALWTPGLAPVLGYAGLTIKPHLFDLLERFYIPLGTELRPALKAVVLSLLPGMEEETGEDTERTMKLMDGIRAAVGDEAYFWQCVMLATITAPRRRKGAYRWMMQMMPEVRGAEPAAFVEPEPGLLVRAFVAALRDEDPMTQKDYMELLVKKVPLDCKLLQERVGKEDLKLLVTTTAGVLIRKDVALNRRLWAWYTGPEEGDTLAYFEKNGAGSLVEGLLQMLDVPEEAGIAERARPYRICLSLMDRREVGSVVAPKLFFPAIEMLRQYEKVADKASYAEVFKSANMFFDGIEAGLIWGQILEKVAAAFAAPERRTAVEDLKAVGFILRTFNVREEEMVRVHAPLNTLAVLLRMEKLSGGHEELVQNATLLATALWDLIPEQALKCQRKMELIPTEQALEQIIAFYDKAQSQPNSANAATPPAVLGLVAELSLARTAEFVRLALEGEKGDIDNSFRLFIDVLSKSPRSDACTAINKLVGSFLTQLRSDEAVRFIPLQGIVQAIAILYTKGYLEPLQTDDLVFSAVANLWHYLSPDVPKYHVEAIRGIWALQNALNDRRVEAAVSTVMTAEDVAGTYSVRSPEAARRFAVLWKHSVMGAMYHMVLTRPLFLFLDSLADDAVEMSVFARGWLQNLDSIHLLFWIFVAKFIDCGFLKEAGERDGQGSPKTRHVYGEDDSLEVATYYFQTLLNILRYATPDVHRILANELVVGGDQNRAGALQRNGYGEEDMTLQVFFARAALRAVDGDPANPEQAERVGRLHKVALSVMHQLLLSPYSKGLAELQLEHPIMARLISIMDTTETYVQVSLLDVLYAALKLSLTRPTSQLAELAKISRESLALKPGSNRASMSSDSEKHHAQPQQIQPPQQLLKCLLGGFSKKSARPVLDSWIFFLSGCLPLIEPAIFQMLIPLVGCLCEEIKQTFEALKTIFLTGATDEYEGGGRSPESTLVALLNGLELVLDAAHQRLLVEEVKIPGVKVTDTQSSSGFFGNMVSGVWAGETQQSRSAAANNRLTVVLCFRDTVKVCHSIWSWGDSQASAVVGKLDAASRDSWAHNSLKMRGRARRILEHMFAAETLECLETLIELWPGRSAPLGQRMADPSILKLVNVLDGSRPKHTIPAIFNAIYTRTNPGALDPTRRSTETAELTDMDVVVFLVEYARSLEADAMDEIWSDCMVFLKDVLANPFPHRQTLPSLLGFTAILGEKVDNTNFGEQKKMRKELGDLFLRMLTAVFTVTPQNRSLDLSEKEKENGSSTPAGKTRTTPDDIVDILVLVVPNLRSVLLDPALILQATNTIAASILIPTFRSKSFPSNVTSSLLTLVHHITKLPNSQKSWRSPLSDVFMDPKFFSSSPSLVTSHWIPLHQQYLHSDRDRFPTLLSSLTPPTTSNILFTLTAASARAEADKKATLSLKRISFLLLSAEPDAFLGSYPDLEERLVELLAATPVSSPSAAIKADILLLLRVILLRTSPVHLSSLWPLINQQLHAAFASLFPEAEKEAWDTKAVLGACKLLDALIVLQYDEWQLNEWIFVTDTVDAVFGGGEERRALCDVVAETVSGGPGGPGECGVWFSGEKEREMVEKDVGAFLRSVSLRAYEGVFGKAGEGRERERAVLERVVVRELFDEEM